METQNTDVTIVPSKRTAKRALQLSSATVEKPSNHVVGRKAADRQQDPFQAAAADLATNIDLAQLARMHNLTRQRTIRLPGAADEAAADCPALTKNSKNIAQRVRVRRFKFERPARSSAAWVVAIFAILAFLTVMLMVGIAISV